jgi:hypothetical protein
MLSNNRDKLGIINFGGGVSRSFLNSSSISISSISPFTKLSTLSLLNALRMSSIFDIARKGSVASANGARAELAKVRF